MTICVGRPIIEKLASEGMWASEDGEGLVAASELFGQNPYAEIERLRAALRPFAEADWYATGRGTYDSCLPGDAITAAKACIDEQSTSRGE